MKDHNIILLTQLLTILAPALKHGCIFELSCDDDVYTIDLNTRAKSQCIIKIEDGKFVAYRRYGKQDEFTNFDELIEIVHECAHGRSYFDSGWLAVFQEFQMENPCGVF